MRIMFMGTPDFAAVILRALHEAGEEVCCAVTQPDRPKGRKMQLTPSPVKVYAESAGIPVLQPATLRDGAFLGELGQWQPELIVVAAYAKILPSYVLEHPRFGCVNAHASLLPAYRGAAPIQRALMNGDTESGVTAMRMAEGLDTGDMLLRERVPILPEDDFGTLHDRLAAAGARVILRTLDAIRDGTLTPEPQDGSLATYAAKITREDETLNFAEEPEAVRNRIRALSPAPLAACRLPDGRQLKVAAARILPGAANALPGTVVSLTDGVIAVSCAGGIVGLTEVQPEGKKRMPAAAFINGRRLSVGDRLEKL